jgi:hypothetical protein
MASEEGLFDNEIEFEKTFSTMSKMVNILYDDYLEQKRPILGEYSKAKNEEGEDPPKTPPSPPYSPSTSSSSVQVPNPVQENILININMICLYLSLM